ncbi:hypothetical protein GOBAR_AA13799 [Gossypium barbadense]|uniref:RNase H type-1 domain-containing protein n=1 Tax=Gossypium barbadense TaxID=3634 RepID=A0A2P5XU78_GOSBA|nr:hypothetical protein GOBAR_AA13799 [Gossypium barbadense]
MKSSSMADKAKRYWEQKARVNLLIEGDRNTSFFQNFASKRRRVNRIKSLKDPDGELSHDGLVWSWDNTGFYTVKSGSNTGSVIRNGKGPVFGTCVVLNVNVSTPFAEEALACLQSMAFARHLRLDKMVVEGDSLTVIKKALQWDIVAKILARSGFGFVLPFGFPNLSFSVFFLFFKMGIFLVWLFNITRC